MPKQCEEINSIKELEENIVKDYTESPNYCKIAKKYHICRSRAKQILESYGFIIKPKDANYKQKIGDKFGKLKVLRLEEEFVTYGNSKKLTKRVMAVCECECGREVKFYASSLRKDRKHTCTKCCRAYGEKYYVKRNDYKEINADFWGRIINGRKRGGGREIEFSISQEYAWSILEKQDYKCILTGEKLVIPKRGKDGNASIDRIDNTKGYVEGNIQWVTAEINRMKLDHNQEKFIELCKLVVKMDKRNRRKSNVKTARKT